MRVSGKTRLNRVMVAQYMAPAVTKSIRTQLLVALQSIRAMPGYGDLWWNEGKRWAWLSLGDGDESETYHAAESLLSKVPGVKKVTIEAESAPAKDGKDGWQRIGYIGNWESQKDAQIDALLEMVDAQSDLLKDFALGAPGVPQLVPFDLAGQWRASGEAKTPGPVAAGIAVVAQDSGRVLMIQRSNHDDSDPAGGRWEFPGGCLEGAETAFEGARREWQEEVGIELPPSGSVAGQWDSTDGVFRGYVWLVDSEQKVAIDGGREDTTNPDDPDGDHFEAVAWWKPSDLPGMPALREEVRHGTDWGLLRRFEAAKAALAELGRLARYLRHGKAVAKFRPDRLPESEFRRIATAPNPKEAMAVSRVRLLWKAGPPAAATRRASQRESALSPVLNRTAALLGSLARGHQTSHLGFVDSAAAVLRGAYATAWKLGHRAALATKQEDDEEYDWEDLPPDVQAQLDPRVEDQHGFLQGLVQDLVSGFGVAALASRLDQYSESMVPVYEMGFAAGTADGADEGAGIMATWRVTSEDPCALCEARDGEVTPLEEIEFWPGDGDFGEYCEGAMHCRCVYEYETMPADEGVAQPLSDFEAA